MENAISNYSLVVIEDEQVPLAAGFETASRYGNVFLVLAVVVMAVLVAFIAYTAWFNTHKSRIMSLVNSRRNNIDSVYYFIHPLRLLELEYEAEHNTVNQYFA